MAINDEAPPSKARVGPAGSETHENPSVGGGWNNGQTSGQRPAEISMGHENYAPKKN